MALLLYGVSGDIRDSLGNPSELEYSAASIAIAQKRATNVVNSYLAKTYPDAIPFTSASAVPELVNSIATDLSVYYLKRDKHKGPNPLQDSIKQEYWDKNIALLQSIAKEEIEVPELLNSDRPRIESPQSEYVPTFGQDDETTWTVDPDKLDDDATARDKS